jgi:CybS, succinate dehydrogenase cytochrome B small subunit
MLQSVARFGVGGMTVGLTTRTSASMYATSTCGIRCSRYGSFVLPTTVSTYSRSFSLFRGIMSRSGISSSINSCMSTVRGRPSLTGGTIKKFSTTTTTSSSSASTSTSSSPFLEGDAGALGTKVYHIMHKVLAVLAPIYFFTPESYTTGFIYKSFGVVLSSSIAVHTYIGLNYICRDYVPKISKTLLGPARIVTAGFSLILLIGMSKIAVFSPQGLKGIVTGLWTVKAERVAA